MKTVHTEITTVKDLYEALKSFPMTAPLSIHLSAPRAGRAQKGGLFEDLKVMQNDGGTVVLC